MGQYYSVMQIIDAILIYVYVYVFYSIVHSIQTFQIFEINALLIQWLGTVWKIQDPNHKAPSTILQVSKIYRWSLPEFP